MKKNGQLTLQVSSLVRECAEKRWYKKKGALKIGTKYEL